MTKFVSLGLLMMMVVGFLNGLSSGTGRLEVKSSKEFSSSQVISLSDQIRLARLELGISQNDLAEQTLLTRYNIEAIETGEAVPNGDVLKRLESALKTRLVNHR